MFKKIIFLSAVFFAFSVFAGAKEGLYIRYNIETETDSMPIRGVADYYYQGGDFLAVIHAGDNLMGSVMYLEKDGQKYSLFPKEKTYVETKEFSANPMMFLPQSEGEFVTTGIKKKILGYKCDIFTKETKTTTTHLCLGQKLYANWGAVVQKMGQTEGSHPPKGFPMEIVTINKSSKKQTTVTMTGIRQKDFGKRFEILKDYKKKEGADVQKRSTEMIQSMPQSTPINQNQLDQMEKLTKEMEKKYKP